MKKVLPQVLGLAVALGSAAVPCHALGGFGVTNIPIGDFAQWSYVNGATALVGDFNGDGKADIALVGGMGWQSVPVAFSNGDGTFNVTDAPIGNGFGPSAATVGVIDLVGDFNGDGRADVVLLGGGADWNTVPIAFSNGDGTFGVTNNSVPLLEYVSSVPGARSIVGNFKNPTDPNYKCQDIVVLGGVNWDYLVMALSDCKGDFTLSIADIPFGAWAATPGAVPLVGNFGVLNAQNQRTQGIALVGPPAWASLPVAVSNGDGTFSVTNRPVPDNFMGLAGEAGVVARVGYWNGAGANIYEGIALTGGSGWGSIPVAMSNGDGNFTASNQPIVSFAAWSALTYPLVGDFNGDGKIDIALTAVPTWASVPVAFSLSPVNLAGAVPPPSN